MAKVGDLWKKWKNKLYINHYKKYNTNTEREANIPARVREKDWLWLISYFLSSEYESKSFAGSESRKKMKSIHRSGRKGQSQVAEEIKARDGKSPNRITLWLDTHIGKDDNSMNPHVDAVKAFHDSNPELAKKDLDHDSVASILGPDS